MPVPARFLQPIASAAKRIASPPAVPRPAFLSTLSSAHKLQQDLLLSDRVASAEVRGGTAYVVWASKPWHGRLSFLHGSDEAALRRHLVEEHGHPPESVPLICPVKELPPHEEEEGDGQAPFMLQQILDVLFHEADSEGNGTVSMHEFLAFSRKYGLFHCSEEEIRQVFEEHDYQTFEAFGARQLDEGEFKQLLLDTGLVEVRGEAVGKVGAMYFLEERIVNVVLRHWFAKYDENLDGGIDLREYCKLVADYRLPFAVCSESFREVDRNGDGHIDEGEFREMLRDARVLSTGRAIARSSDKEGLRAAWRAVAPSQRFLAPTHVNLAGEAPPARRDAVRFVCISDTHGAHRDLRSLPPGDVLLHAGDFSMCGGAEELRDFGRWLSALPYERKIFTAGNHDLTLDRYYEAHASPEVADAARALLLSECDSSVRFLHDEECEFRGVRVYGSAWQPAFGSWAFGLPRGQALREKWAKIPAGIDVLLVHGPPLGRGDCIEGGQHVGCADLLAELQERVRPSFCVAGHLHEGHGTSFDGHTHYLNACSCDEAYTIVNDALVFDVPL